MAKAAKKKKKKANTPTYESRRPLDSMVIPEGENFGSKSDGNRVDLDQMKEAYVELFKAALAEGMDKREIKSLLGLREDVFEKVEKKVINEDGQTEITKASPYRYYEYLQRQEKCVRDLEYYGNQVDKELEFYQEAQKEFLKGKLEKLPPGRANIQAGIMAVKAKSEIIDKMIKTGQDLGIVEKRAKELRVLGNINLAALPTEELKSLLSKKMGEMGALSKKEKLPTVYTKMLEAQIVDGEARVIDEETEE